MNQKNMATTETTGNDLIEMLGQSRLFRDVPMDMIAHLLLDLPTERSPLFDKRQKQADVLH